MPQANHCTPYRVGQVHGLGCLTRRFVQVTDVEFAPLDDETIAAYVETGEPMCVRVQHLIVSHWGDPTPVRRVWRTLTSRS